MCLPMLDYTHEVQYYSAAHEKDSYDGKTHVQVVNGQGGLELAHKLHQN